jgi:serine/threonine protein kinase
MEPLRGDDPRQIGRYKLVARLGAGGMGQVFLGFSPSGRPMAVKVVHRDLARDQAFLHRFRQEVAAARKVSGAYTAPVVDAGYGDLPWLATTLVVGPSLADAVAQQGPLPEAAVWRLAAGLAEALAEVHSCGLVHRDLKPSNVLLAADGPRVIDFGISRALDGTAITGTGMLIGTPAFMSPEQASGAPVGPASDVFSFGGVLTFAATGSGPFGDGNPVAMMYRVVHGEPGLAMLPGALAELVSRCLAKRPEDRATLAELMEVITAKLAPAEVAMSFWPQGLADFIGSYQARLSSGMESLPPLVPEEARPEPPAPEQVQPRAPEQLQLRTPEQVQPPVPDEPTGPTGSGDQHPATEVAASHGQEDGPKQLPRSEPGRFPGARSPACSCAIRSGTARIPADPFAEPAAGIGGLDRSARGWDPGCRGGLRHLIFSSGLALCFLWWLADANGDVVVQPEPEPEGRQHRATRRHHPDHPGRTEPADRGGHRADRRRKRRSGGGHPGAGAAGGACHGRGGRDHVARSGDRQQLPVDHEPGCRHLSGVRAAAHGHEVRRRQYRCAAGLVL